MLKNENPFEELPEGLVDEMLSNAKTVSSNLHSRFKEIFERKGEIRRRLESSGGLRSYSEIDSARTYPTSAGIDGTYTMVRMLSMDLACVAVVASVGLVVNWSVLRRPEPSALQPL